MKRFLSVCTWVLICFAMGAVAACFQSDALREWYPHLNISPLTPAGWVFPVAWSVLYLLMGISVGLLHGVRSIYSTILYMLFVMQLVLNFLWSIFFFHFRSPLLGVIDIVMLDIFVLIYFVGAYVVKRASAYLVIPYLLWLAFATYLNMYVAIYN